MVDARPQAPASTTAITVLVALVCWAGVVFALVLVLAFVIAGSAESMIDQPDWVAHLLGALWLGATLVLATRLAAGVLRRRGMQRVTWLAALPTAVYFVAILAEGIPDPVWPTALQAAIAIGGSIAAVTLWRPAPSPVRWDELR